MVSKCAFSTQGKLMVDLYCLVAGGLRHHDALSERKRRQKPGLHSTQTHEQTQLCDVISGIQRKLRDVIRLNGRCCLVQAKPAAKN